MTDIARHNVTVSPRELHVEIMNPQTGDVWLLQDPITVEQFKALRVAPPLVKSGCAAGSFDAAHFLRSPGAEQDGPLEICEVDGRTFVRVARALAFSGKGPMLVKVQKHHVMTFAKGREVTIARVPDGGLYVQQTESVPGKTFEAPADWQLHRATLSEDWTVLVPPPVSVFFFPSLASFQGPLADASLPAALREKLT
jgi:hypothetical protein